ncbi:hypothetical protein BDW42DRAFT_189353 [Aspergillus taichungensis]|uniref:Nucleosome assembly protein n=1 Tax=Aspergillus taichungensis TaxID=482145 RepID=A0A2J5HEU8_9EURO|nr:hypothetical protein BDW42DRAFT_189353 [Aspergillus taichungensis]
MAEEQKSLAERIEVPDIPKAAAKKIALLEQQFLRAEVEQLKHSIPLFRPIYEERSKVISTPEVQENFWMRVFSHAPAEIDEYITTADAAALGTALKNVSVERFEVDEAGQGEPRSIRFVFEFRTGEENPFFTDEKLVKEFYWRKRVTKTQKGNTIVWEGLVSEPVRVHWKEDRDLTKGLLDAACDLAEAEKKGGERKKLPEFKKLVSKIEEVEAEAAKLDEEGEGDDDEEDFPVGPSPAGTSFFSFFGYRGRDVSAEESAKATKEDEERYQKMLKGEKVDGDDDEAEEDDEEEEEDDEVEALEIFPDGEELAVALAEDLWPNALKYYGGFAHFGHGCCESC